MAVACGDSKSPTAPSPVTPSPAPAPQPTPTPAPTPQFAAVFGVVTNARTGAPVAGATVNILAPNHPPISTSTDGNGYYHAAPVPQGKVTIEYRAVGYLGINQTPTIAGDTRHDVRLDPVFSITGRGNQVFDLPARQMRIRVYARWSGRGTSNFALYVGGRLIVNTILRNQNPYEGTHLVFGGTSRTEIADNVEEWRIEEIP